MSGQVYDTTIIGGGVAGLAAAMYAGRLQLKTTVFAEKLGGMIILTDHIENYPGYKKISGLDLATNLEEHAKEYGAEFIEKKVTKIEKLKDGSFKVISGDTSIITKTLILATGTDWKKLNIPGEKEYTNKGVHYCALCDGAVYKNKVIAVVGGSDSAVREGLMLSEFGKKVYIIYRGEKLRAESANLNKLKEKNIEVITNINMLEIKGEKFVRSVLFDKPFQGKNELLLDAVFVNIGHVPISNIGKEIGVKLNNKNEIIIDREGKTNINGVFAAGDVVDTRFKQAITGVAEGVTAAYSAYHYIHGKKPETYDK